MMQTTDRTRNEARVSEEKSPGASQSRSGLLPPLKRQDFDRAGKFGTNVSMAMEALRANRLRSFLTLLGIFIGVAAVIASYTMTQGVGASFTSAIASLGTNLIIITPGTNNKAGGGPGHIGKDATNRTNTLTSSATVQSLTPADVQAIENGPTRIPDVTAVSAVVGAPNTEVIFGDQNWSTTAQGVAPSYQSMRNLTIEEGTWLSTEDDQAGRSVAVLGQTVYQQLFADVGQNPLGQTIQIGTSVYRVIGVLQAQGGEASADDVVYVPFTTAMARLKTTSYVDQIVVQADSANNLDAVQQAITSLLEQRHHIIRGMADDFTITTSAQLLQTFNQEEDILGTLLISIASISLTVGGIGIMNIMLVSVTERTREIGVRMSLGAGRQDIRNQFLIEALTLSLTGGAIGLLLGLLIGFGITRMLALPFVVTPVALLLPFGVSAGIGIIFGFYPAARAARLDPIEALRSL
jgi:putative ABC transport system permease protein